MKRIDEIANNAQVSEKALEAYLVRRVQMLGGIALKYSNPNQVGFPDRLVILPEGKTFWCEMKSRGKKARAIQVQRMEQLRRLGQRVFLLDSREGIDKVIDEMV